MQTAIYFLILCYLLSHYKQLIESFFSFVSVRLFSHLDSKTSVFCVDGWAIWLQIARELQKEKPGNLMRRVKMFQLQKNLIRCCRKCLICTSVILVLAISAVALL